ncbi:putative calcium-binding protein [Ananas comosus]|uniref:Putative calcium-binding protein n=1 Tax=Ananas comosus TaxID=4615 RepID=A0A199UM21_ANACO|nr:putative calcium-binding protein [Ananas comosus]
MMASSSSSSASSSTRDPSELRRVFRMFDRNGDGRITRKELGDSLRNLGIFIPDDDLAAMIAKIDANGDGCVDMAEFGALYDSIMADNESNNTKNTNNDGDGDDDDGKEKGEEEEEDMREAFKVFDQNGDGFITVDELRSVLASLGLKQGRTVEDCRRMIHQVDKDGDGRVDFAEFKQMMRGGGFAALGTATAAGNN